MFSLYRHIVLTCVGLLGLLGLLGFCATGVLPCTATAKGSHFVVPPSRFTEFHVKGSTGYSILVFASRGQVSITARRGSSSATYVVHGVTSPERIAAKVGARGRISVRFHPSGPRQLVPLPRGNCRGQGEVLERGEFVGRIEFAGEQGYTTVDVSRAMGRVVKFLKETCNRNKGGGGPPFLWTILNATSNSMGISVMASRALSFSHPRLNGSAFSASVIETSPEVLAVIRTINASSDLDAFATTELGNGFKSAVVSPPAPFSGTATYERTKDGATWLGSLTGDFLGRGLVSLAGEGFSAEILHGR
jgi:hypothetical protein